MVAQYTPLTIVQLGSSKPLHQHFDAQIQAKQNVTARN